RATRTRGPRRGRGATTAPPQREMNSITNSRKAAPRRGISRIATRQMVPTRGIRRPNHSVRARRPLERQRGRRTPEGYDRDSGRLRGRVVDLHAEGLMLLSEKPIELNRAWALQVNLAMTLDGVSEFTLDAESRWNRESIGGQQFWTGLQFTYLPDESRQCIERMVSSR